MRTKGDFFSYRYKKITKPPTYAQIASGEIVRLYSNQPNSPLVHKSEKRHAGLHSYFCRVRNCPYHNDPY